MRGVREYVLVCAWIRSRCAPLLLTTTSCGPRHCLLPAPPSPTPPLICLPCPSSLPFFPGNCLPPATTCLPPLPASRHCLPRSRSARDFRQKRSASGCLISSMKRCATSCGLPPLANPPTSNRLLPASMPFIVQPRHCLRSCPHPSALEFPSCHTSSVSRRFASGFSPPPLSICPLLPTPFKLRCRPCHHDLVRWCVVGPLIFAPKLLHPQEEIFPLKTVEKRCAKEKGISESVFSA